MTYQADDSNTFGAYYQTKEKFRFDDAIILQPAIGPIGTIPLDVNLDLPQNIGLGWANTSLLGGRLLLATDVVFKMWDEATLFQNVYKNQIVVQLGAQYTAGRAKFRMGYAWNENPLRDLVGTSISGIFPAGGVNALQFIQGQIAAIGQHQISGGFTVMDVLPGVDFNFFAGGMFFASQQFGLTSASVESYWAGGGITWRFNRGVCCDAGAPDRW
jgi:long-chain fatty acid transport protein